MNIFIVDDDELLCFILKKQIGKFDSFEIWGTATNGLKALEALKDAHEKNTGLPDLILLDINMPVMDGWEFLDAFGEFASNLSEVPKICILSSSINRDDHDKSKTYKEVNQFFTKPLLDSDIETLGKI